MSRRNERSAVVHLLPWAERPDVAAGYVMVAVAPLSLLAYAGVAGVLYAIEPADRGLLALLLLPASVVFAVGLPISFVLGTLAWRRSPPDPSGERPGLVLGGWTALCSLLLTCALVGLAVGVLFAVGEPSVAGPLEIALVLAAGPALMLFFAMLLGSWIVAPIGALCGWYYETRLRDQSPNAARQRAVE